MMRPSKPWSRSCSARSSTDDRRRGRLGTQIRRRVLTSAAELKCRQVVKFWGESRFSHSPPWTWHQNLGAVEASPKIGVSLIVPARRYHRLGDGNVVSIA